MNKPVIYQLNFFLFLFAIALFFTLSSCVTQKRVKYVQTKDSKDTTNVFILKNRTKNTVRPFDNLYISIISPDEVTSNMFNSQTGRSVNQNIDYHMISYMVNDSGYVDFPFVGQIYVEGLTILEAKDAIQNALSQYISNASVIVKFVGKYITVLGEVTRQGEFNIYADNISIFSAIAKAGGITEFGDRENVTIIREESGKTYFHQIDLTDKKVTVSDFYYLKPEDIIIVQPLKQKSYGFASFPYALVLSSLTTLTILLTFIRTM